jgi:hypothetical protein
MIIVPGDAPQQLRVDGDTASGITISWGRVDCVQRNSEITGYGITFGRTGGSIVVRQLLEENMVAVNGTGPGDRTFTATGLLPRTSYTFNVMAVNGQGEVGPAASIMETTETPEGKKKKATPEFIAERVGNCALQGLN